MIYHQAGSDDPIDQADIIDNCPIVSHFTQCVLTFSPPFANAGTAEPVSWRRTENTSPSISRTRLAALVPEPYDTQS